MYLSSFHRGYMVTDVGTPGAWPDFGLGYLGSTDISWISSFSLEIMPF